MTQNELVKMIDDFRAVLTCPYTKEELQKFTWGEPESGGKINEQSFERLWAPITHALNLILKKCAAKTQDNADPTRIVIGDGDCAKRKAPEALQATIRKKPDFAGYEQKPGRTQYVKDEPLQIANRIPGDAKLFRKIRHSMLPPNGAEYDPIGKSAEAQKVINQIYDYLDQHEARYGYLVNDQELIFFKRRGTGWGHMEIGPPIKHDIDAAGHAGKISNTKLVLLYFHLIIANDESQWKLKSNRPQIKRRKNPQRGLKAPPTPMMKTP